MHTLAFRDETRKDIALIALTDRADKLQSIRTLAESSAPELQKRLRFLAGERWQVDVTPYAFQVGDLDDYGLNGDWRLVEAMVAEVNPGHEHNYWHLCGVWTGAGNAGIAGMDSGRALTYGVDNIDTQVHELGHNFGMGHDKDSTIMSASRNNYFSGSGMEYIGLVAPAHVVHVAGNQRLFLVPPETRDEAVGSTEHKIAYFKRGQYEMYGVAVYDGTVKIQQSIAGAVTTPWSTIKAIATLRQPGDTWQDVKFAAWRDGAAVVTIGDAPERPHAPMTLPGGSEPVPGIWHDPRYSHQGLDLRVTDDGRVVGYWFTWTARGPYWLLLEGPVRDGVAELVVNAPNPIRGERRLQVVGRAALSFDGGNSATLRYHADLDDWFWTGRGQLNLERIVSAADDPLTGCYDFREAEYEGLTVSVVGEDRVIGYWFTYTWIKGELRPTWRFLDGPRRGELTCYEPKDGAHLVATASHLETWAVCDLYRTAFRCDEKGVRTKLDRLI